MAEPRTLLRVTVRITPKEGNGERLIRAELIRLPDESPQDTARRIERFRIRIEDRGRTEEYLRYSNSIREIKDGLRSRLHRLLEAVNHNTHVVKVQEDTDGLLEEYIVRCQYCPKVITHSLGQIHGVLKKCSGCGSLTTGRFEPVSE